MFLLITRLFFLGYIFLIFETVHSQKWLNTEMLTYISCNLMWSSVSFRWVTLRWYFSCAASYFWRWLMGEAKKRMSFTKLVKQELSILCCKAICGVKHFITESGTCLPGFSNQKKKKKEYLAWWLGNSDGIGDHLYFKCGLHWTTEKNQVFNTELLKSKFILLLQYSRGGHGGVWGSLQQEYRVQQQL